MGSFEGFDRSDLDGLFDDFDYLPFSSVNPNSERPVDISNRFVPDPLYPNNWQGWNHSTNSILAPPRGLISGPHFTTRDLNFTTSNLDLTTPRIDAAAAPPFVTAPPATAAPAVVTAPAALPDVAPPAATPRTLKRKQGSSVDPPASNKRPRLNGKSSSVTRVSVPPPGEDIMKTCSAGLLLLLADNSRIMVTAKEMATKSGVGLPSSNFLSTLIRRYQITGLMFLTSGFWSLVLGDDPTLVRHLNCIPKLAGLLKIVEAARFHSPDYKARVQAWAKAVRQPYDAERAHLFKLRPSDTLLRAISFVVGPISYAQVKDVSFPGGSCKIRGAHKSKIVTWSPEPEVVMENEAL